MFDTKHVAFLITLIAVLWKFNSKDLKPEPISNIQTGEVIIRFNGNATEYGYRTILTAKSDMDNLIRDACAGMPMVRDFAKHDDDRIRTICDPQNGARLFSEVGVRIMSSKQLIEAESAYLVPQGIQFVWPLAKVGTVIYPKNVESPIPDKPIKLTQLSMAPRAFIIENFITDDEVQEILDRNQPAIAPSEVGYKGEADTSVNSQRNSSTAWDHGSRVAKNIQKRAFDLTSVDFDPEAADALQILRYKETEWYKPHMDSFDEEAYDSYNPVENNGTNRFATVFIYLSDIEEGGHTVFPLSTTHEGYNGEQLVHPGTIDTPGYIAERDAKWVCNTSSSALRSKTFKGHAVLFYSQGPDSSLDPYSLHGGCPPIKGIKWSANVWLWNRPKPRDDEESQSTTIHMSFKNDMSDTVELFWDDGTEEMVTLGMIEAGEKMPMKTYDGHRFVAKLGGRRVLDFQASKNQKRGETVVIGTPKQS